MAACFIPVWKKIVPEESKTVESDLLFFWELSVYFGWRRLFFIKPFLEETLITSLMRRVNGQKNDHKAVIVRTGSGMERD